MISWSTQIVPSNFLYFHIFAIMSSAEIPSIPSIQKFNGMNNELIHQFLQWFWDSVPFLGKESLHIPQWAHWWTKDCSNI